MTDYLKLSRKRVQLKNMPDPFPPHKVTLKAIWTRPQPHIALRYLVDNYGDGIGIVVSKHRQNSIVIKICCGEDLYQKIKLNFVKDMGNEFIWKD